MKTRAAFFYDYPMRDGDVYGGRREKLAELTELYPHVVTAKNFNDHAAQLREVEVIFATWGMISFTEAHFAAMPKLRAVFYAAGNVKAFAPPLVERGVVLVSAWAVNAIPTAELVYAQILLTCRGYFRGVRQYAATRDAAAAKDFRRAGAAGETIGLLGTGFIAQKLTKHLHAHGFRVIASASDPFLTDERARAMGVERVPLEEVFARSYVVSNHVPDLPSTKHILGGALFERMREGATFINSGRGGDRGRARARAGGAPRSHGAAGRDLPRAARARVAAVALAERRDVAPRRRHDRRRGGAPRRLRDRRISRLARRPATPLPGDARSPGHHGLKLG
jgi:phosphoglycerate dehydrogenase-like enzyme